MLRLRFILTCWLACFFIGAIAQSSLTPDVLFGELFRDVQMKKVFNDGKTFVDCIPKKDPKLIVNKYLELKKSDSTINLKSFVEENFNIPIYENKYAGATKGPIVEHINQLWSTLRRPPSEECFPGESKLFLPYAYVVPGGRFRELYYWDTYFTMLGLKESEKSNLKLIESMVNNYAYLIKTYGHIPNGSRTYYLSRSQPPFFSLMVDLLAEIKGQDVYLNYLPSLEKEYAYWMDRTAPTKHRVSMPDGSVLNRYYDQIQIPRQEMYMEDVTAFEQAGTRDSALFRNIRSAAESGWDFSSRWFADGGDFKTIQTTQLVPVDLNCLLYHLELTLAKCYRMKQAQDREQEYIYLAKLREKSIQRYLWSEEKQWYVDFNIKTQQPSSELTLAGVFPLYLGVAKTKQAAKIKKNIIEKFLKPGGVVTSLKKSGQQWDAPNGWAPLQWITIVGLTNYGYKSLASNIAHRWLALNTSVYNRTGKLMEKYNVIELSLMDGGGEYPSQDGFGWTNGVYLALYKRYKR